jgi:hypothetical protein
VLIDPALEDMVYIAADMAASFLLRYKANPFQMIALKRATETFQIRSQPNKMLHTQQANDTVRTTDAAADHVEHAVRHRSEARGGARRDAGVEGRPGELRRLPRDGLCV